MSGDNAGRQPFLAILPPRVLFFLAGKVTPPAAEKLRTCAEGCMSRFVIPLLRAGSTDDFDSRVDELLVPFTQHTVSFLPQLLEMAESFGFDFIEFLETASRTLVSQTRKQREPLDPLQRQDIEWSAEVLCYGNVALVRNLPKEELAKALAEAQNLTREQLPQEARRYMRACYLLVLALEFLENTPPNINSALIEHVCDRLYWDAAFADDVFRALKVDWRALRDREAGGRQRRIHTYAAAVLEGLSEDQKNRLETALLDRDSFFPRRAPEAS